MTVDYTSKQRKQVQGEKLDTKQTNHLGKNQNDLQQQKANIVDSSIKDNQQSSGKRGLSKSQWMGDL